MELKNLQGPRTQYNSDVNGQKKKRLSEKTKRFQGPPNTQEPKRILGTRRIQGSRILLDTKMIQGPKMNKGTKYESKKKSMINSKLEVEVPE